MSFVPRSLIFVAGYSAARLSVRLSIVLLLVGCAERSQIRSYTVEPEEERIVTTDAIRNQFPVIPFRWEIPPDWRIAENDQFSAVAWSAGPIEADRVARITLSEVSTMSGLSSQIIRWRGQIGMSEVGPDEAVKELETISLDRHTGSWAQLRGPEETILGLIITTPQKMWIFKYRSPNKTADELKSSFRKFCESVRLLESEPPATRESKD